MEETVLSDDAPLDRPSLLEAFDEAIDPEGFNIDGYEVLGELDRGGMGVVYHAVQLEPEREVALKVMLPRIASDENMRARFQIEARAMAGLDHPGILPVYEVGESNGLPFFSMKLAPGGSLSERLKSGELGFRESAELLRDIAGAVHFAHQHGVLHRDLKPGNFLFDDEGRVYVSDFGVAKMLGEGEDDLGLTRTQNIIGTPHYLPPELAAGSASEWSVAGDLYSLGAVFYECVTGERPFSNETNMAALLRTIVDEPLTNPKIRRPGLPLDLEVICRKALDKDPAQRYASVQAFADDLGRWLTGRPIKARPLSTPGRLWRWARRHPLPAALGSALVVTAGAGSVLLAFSHHERGLANVRAESRLHESLIERSRAEHLLAAPGFRERSLELLHEAAELAPSDRIATEAAATLANKIDLEPTDAAEPPPSPPTLPDGESHTRLQHAPFGAWTLSFYESGRAALWREGSGKPEHVWVPTPGGVNAVLADFAAASATLAVARTPDGAMIYRGDALANSQPIDVPDTLTHIALAPDGSAIATCGDRIEIRDLADGAVRWRLEGGNSRCTPAWSPDSRQLAVVLGHRREVLLINAAGGEIATSEPLSHWPDLLTFHPDGRFLAAAGNELTLLNPYGGDVSVPLEAPAGDLWFDEESNRVLVTTMAENTAAWKIHAPAGYREWAFDNSSERSNNLFDSRLSYDEKFLITSTTDGIEIWSVGRAVRTGFHAVENQRIDARTSAWWLPGTDNSVLVQIPGGLERFDVTPEGKVVDSGRVPRVPGAKILDIQADGTWLVDVEDEDGESMLEQWPNGDHKVAVTPLPDLPTAAPLLSASACGGRCLARVIADNRIEISGEFSFTLTPPRPSRVHQILFSKDGSRLFAVAEDHSICDWDLDTLSSELVAEGF